MIRIDLNFASTFWRIEKRNNELKLKWSVKIKIYLILNQLHKKRNQGARYCENRPNKHDKRFKFINFVEIVDQSKQNRIATRPIYLEIFGFFFLFEARIIVP